MKRMTMLAAAMAALSSSAEWSGWDYRFIPSPQPQRANRMARYKTKRVRAPSPEQAAKTTARYRRRQANYDLCISYNPCLQNS